MHKCMIWIAKMDDPICGLHAACSGFAIPDHKCIICISKTENPFHCLSEKCLGKSNVHTNLRLYKFSLGVLMIYFKNF
jgi:hypothetical protein